MEFHGELAELKDLIQQAGCSGEWATIEHGHQFRGKDGSTLNWYHTGKMSFGGRKDLKDALSQRVRAILEDGEVLPTARTWTTRPGTDAGKKVFVVHGHDAIAREQLELILHRLGLQPFVLMNTGGGGLTIIEALQQEIGTHDNAARFGIVLMTPDDMGYAKQDGAESIEPRARQNVVLEMGMLLQAVGKRNVAILKKGHLEVPSDADGVIYLSFNDHVKEVVTKLVDRLHSAGFAIDPGRIASASS